MALKDKMSVGRKGEVVMANATGGQEIPTPEVKTMTDPFTSQTVDVRGTKRMRPDKKPVKATWY